MEPPPLPREVAQALDRLDEAGVRAYVVGGALRDAALGRAVRDFDVVVLAPLERVRDALPDSVLIRARQPVLSLGDRARGPRLEIASLRAGARTLEQDLRLRDFTVNALALDARRGVFVDPCGGRADLEARVLRTAAPARAFRDDPVRILRGVRLAVELGLHIEPETRRAMERSTHRLLGTAAERRRDELLRLLALRDATAGIQELRRLGALAGVLPELLRLVGVSQNPHHRDDVYAHTLAVCTGVRPEPLLRLAALLHDAAKPETKTVHADSGRVSFLRHELRGLRHVERAAARLRLSNRERDRLARLVRHHLLFPDRLATAAAIRRMLRRVGSDILQDLLELRRADFASRRDATGAEGVAAAAWERTERRICELARVGRASEPGPLAIGGQDVMSVLGIEAGPEVGRWLRRARRRVIERPEENERSRLLQWLRRAAVGEAE